MKDELLDFCLELEYESLEVQDEGWVHDNIISEVGDEHSSKSYKSTKAIMIIDEVLKNASPIRRMPKKSDNKNQKGFEYMLLMIYKHNDIGTVKLTIGVRKNTQKVQYGLTALRPGQSLTGGSAKKKKRSS